MLDKPAALIFYNGVLLTMEQDHPQVQAIAILGDEILAVGSNDEILAMSGPETQVIDLEGRTLMPGFVDPHSHIFSQWPGDPEGAQNDILAKGITTYAEMSAPESIMQGIIDLDGSGQLRLRVSLYPAHVDNCGNLLGSWYLEKFPVTREPGALLQIPGVKIFNDGGSCNVPATSYHYVGRDDYGDLYFNVDELTAMISKIQNTGYQVAIHFLGDRAIEVSQKAIAAALGGGANIHHHRIEHNSILPDKLLPVYSEHDIVAMIFGYFPTCFFIAESGQYTYRTPQEFEDWEWRWRPLIDANPDAHIAWHADSPPMGPENPLLHLQGFVTRTEVREDGSICEPPDWAADDLLSVEEALPMMTIEAAYAVLRDDEIGSLKAGKLADLIILSENPMTVDPNRLKDLEVWMTIVGGQVAYCANGSQKYCPQPQPFPILPEEPAAEPTESPLEPVTIKLKQNAQERVPAGTPIQLTTNWLADSQEHAADFLAAVSLHGTLDGQPLPDLDGSWGSIAPYQDRGYITQWLYPLGILSPGAHDLEIWCTLGQPVTDGYDENNDGQPDMYSGETWRFTVPIEVY